MRPPDHYNYANEAEIIWTKPEAQAMPYLRESTRTVSDRRQRRRMPERVVAYTALKADASGIRSYWRHRTWEIRYWWLASHDPYPSVGGPCEAIDPYSIVAGQPARSMSDDQWERQGDYRRYVRPSPVSDPLPRMWK